jgi:flagellar biogenesis protein FliO
MLFDSQDKSIMMIKVGNKTYLSLKDAYRSEKSNANAGLYVGIGMLILSIGMVLILLWLSS